MYVSESYSRASREVESSLKRPDVGQEIVRRIQPLHVLTKTQYGYRSSATESGDGIEGPSSTWKDSREIVRNLEQEYLSGGPRYFSVNDRDYQETRATVREFNGHFRIDNPVSIHPDVEDVYWHGYLQLSGGGNPKPPSMSTLGSMAAKMLRRSAPMQSEIDLVRSLGELKDFPAMMRASRFRWTGVNGLAGSYLNYVFGYMPTASDLRKTVETVISADSILQNYLEHETTATHRRRSETIWSDTAANSAPLYTTAMGQYPSGNFIVDPAYKVRVHMSQVVPWFSYGGAHDVHTPVISVSYVGQQVLRTFATFEYFVPKPEGFPDRLRSYRAKAERLLGGGLDASTAYELTPFTWLVDWFVDIGGLIRYQQHVANNQMVMSRCGWSLTDEFVVRLSITDWLHTSRHSNPGVCIGHNLPYPEVMLRTKKVVRRRGNPYSISPTWDLSPQQWAILAAMGLARSSGVPLIKR